jgi:hypothetical protein
MIRSTPFHLNVNHGRGMGIVVCDRKYRMAENSAWGALANFIHNHLLRNARIGRKTLSDETRVVGQLG